MTSSVGTKITQVNGKITDSPVNVPEEHLTVRPTSEPGDLVQITWDQPMWHTDVPGSSAFCYLKTGMSLLILERNGSVVKCFVNNIVGWTYDPMQP
jgi:hypothetical protein